MTNANDYYKQGFSFHENGDLEEAEKLYLKGLTIDPNNLNCLYMMTNLKIQQLRYPEAEKFVKKAIELKPLIQFYDLLCRIKIEREHYKEATEAAIQGLRINPESFELNFNLALAFKCMGNYELSLKFYQRAEKLDPISFLVPYNMSAVYGLMGYNSKATEFLQKALILNPNNDELKYFLSLAMFKEKKYKDGLPLFESRLCKKTATLFEQKLHPVDFATSREWRGEDISNKTVYMFYEAGFGDVIQYARYFPLLKQKCKKLLFKPQEELIELFEENPLGIDQIITYKDDKVDFDIYVPMLSLPYLLGLDETNMFVYRDGYLKPNLQKQEEFKQKFFNNDKVKIGIKWQGNTASDTDRVIDVDAFIPLFELSNTQFYSFQTGKGSEKIEALTKNYNIIDISKEFNNFSDTAAALECLDFVICNDTSLLHLAGAIKKTSFMLLPLDSNWRWHSDFEHNDWYSSVKSFRQTTNGNWSEPINKVFKELEQIIQNH